MVKAVRYAQYIDQITAFVKENDVPDATTDAPASVAPMLLLPAVCPTADRANPVKVIASGPVLYLPADMGALEYAMTKMQAESMYLLTAGEPVRSTPAPAQRDVVLMDPVQLPLLETNKGVLLPLIRTELHDDELVMKSTTTIAPRPSAGEVVARHDETSEDERRKELSLCRVCGEFTFNDADEDGGYTCEKCQPINDACHSEDTTSETR
jgi:hypothetical protein